MNNSLAEVHPELVSEWSEKNLPLTPDDITFGSNKKVWWKGTCGHEWETSVKARSNGEKCPICYGFRVVSGRTPEKKTYGLCAVNAGYYHRLRRRTNRIFHDIY